MKKKLVLAMAATMAITSCAVPVLADDAAAEGGKIGISMPTQSLERWNRDGSYLEEQFKAAGYDVELTYSDNETDRQVNDIQNLISDGVNLLVIASAASSITVLRASPSIAATTNRLTPSEIRF